MQWHHFVVSYDGITARMFLDGQYTGQVVTTLNTSSNTKLDVGNSPSGTANCAVDSVRVFNRQLSPWEIQALYFLGT
jgi:hypothetical protein